MCNFVSKMSGGHVHPSLSTKLVIISLFYCRKPHSRHIPKGVIIFLISSVGHVCAHPPSECLELLSTMEELPASPPLRQSFERLVSSPAPTCCDKRLPELLNGYKHLPKLLHG